MARVCVCEVLMYNPHFQHLPVNPPPNLAQDKDGDVDIVASNIQQAKHFILDNDGSSPNAGFTNRTVGSCTQATNVVPADVSVHALQTVA
jgi:hypothetical protein